jgi:hypothetical protein
MAVWCADFLFTQKVGISSPSDHARASNSFGRCDSCEGEALSELVAIQVQAASQERLVTLGKDKLQYRNPGRARGFYFISGNEGST